MPTATLTSKGQITLPKAVRDLWGLTPGDRVDFVIDDVGRVELRPLAARAREAFGMLYRADRVGQSVAELDAARDTAVVADEARIRSDWQARPPSAFDRGDDGSPADADGAAGSGVDADDPGLTP